MKINKKTLVKLITEELNKLNESPMFGFEIEVGSKQMAEVILQMIRGYAVGKPVQDVDMDRRALGMLATELAQELGVPDDGTGQITAAADEEPPGYR